MKKVKAVTPGQRQKVPLRHNTQQDLSHFPIESGGTKTRSCCIVITVRRNEAGYSLIPPDDNTITACGCLHISLRIDIIVKFVNHIPLLFWKLRSPSELHFFAAIYPAHREKSPGIRDHSRTRHFSEGAFTLLLG
ncbi:MAG: hypothetical protein II628_03170 [Lachnospiraceae bacterium]|nr:hypothetical protein [Lachnospiraceae bacterium]